MTSRVTGSTRIILVRHGMCAPAGRTLAGRRDGIHLSELGRVQASRLAGHLKATHVTAVYTSPVDRAVETANAIGEGVGAPVESIPDLTEFDFGAWTGREMTALQQDPGWMRFNAYRSGTRAPNGELALEAQARAVTALYRLAARHVDQRIVVVTHADVIRSILAHVLGMPLDLQHRVEIDAGSLSTLELQPAGARVLCINHVAR